MADSAAEAFKFHKERSPRMGEYGVQEKMGYVVVQDVQNLGYVVVRNPKIGEYGYLNGLERSPHNGWEYKNG